jgi:hypothetical protein
MRPLFSERSSPDPFSPLLGLVLCVLCYVVVGMASDQTLMKHSNKRNPNEYNFDQFETLMASLDDRVHKIRRTDFYPGACMRPPVPASTPPAARPGTNTPPTPNRPACMQ